VTRRHAVPLLILALLVAGLAVMQRGVEIRAPESPGIDPFELVRRAHPPRARSAERPATPAPRSVRVAVTSMDGKPIAGARVELVPGPDSDVVGRFVPTAAAPPRGRAVAADENGNAQLDDVPAGRWFVVAEAPGFARHALAGLVREGDEPVDAAVALEKGHAFAGTVRDPDGAPAAGVTVILVPRAPYVRDATCLRTTTSNDGSYRFEGVEAREHGLWYVARAEICVYEASVLIPQIDGLDIRMERGATIEGTVHDADTGAVVAGARVLAFRYTDSRISGLEGLTALLDTAVTDPLGRFSMRTWRRRTDVTYLLVDADGYVASPVDRGGNLDVKGAEEGQRFAADLRVRREGTVFGTVSIEGRPAVGVHLRVRPADEDAMDPPGGRGWVAVTGSDGGYRCDRLPAGAGTIYVWADQFPPLADDVPVEIRAGRDTECNVAVKAHRERVTRRVADDSETPRPLAGVDVTQRIGHLSAAARTDEDGRFTMDAWFLGEYAPVELRRGAFVQASYIRSDDADGADLHPGPPAADAAKGVVVGADGAPAPGIRVELSAGMQFEHEFGIVWRAVREAVSGPDGTFRLPVLSGPEYGVREVGTPWPEGDRDEDGSYRLQLPEAFRFDGRVIAAETGEPIARALVFAGAYGPAMTRTDADGRFAVEGPPSLISKIRVVSEGRLDATAKPEPEDWIIAMRPALSVAGLVRLADGTPVRGALVRLTGCDEPPTSTTDDAGRFVLSGLGAGKCEIEASDPERCRIATTRVAAQAGTRDVSVVVRPGVRFVVRVTDARGKGLSWAAVTVHTDAAETPDETARTRWDGEVSFAAVPDATYTIRVERKGSKAAERRDVRAGEEPVNIVLTPADDD
jgi:hypothetical protein